MTVAKLNPPRQIVELLPYDDTLKIRGDRYGLSLRGLLAVGALDAKLLRLQPGQTIRVYGTDGQCWVDVTGVAPDGTAILRPDAGTAAWLLATAAAATTTETEPAATQPPAPQRGRPAKAAA